MLYESVCTCTCMLLISELTCYAKHSVFPWVVVSAMNNIITLICGSIRNRLITNHSYTTLR